MAPDLTERQRRAIYLPPISHPQTAAEQVDWAHAAIHRAHSLWPESTAAIEAEKAARLSANDDGPDDEPASSALLCPMGMVRDGARSAVWL